MLFFTASLWVMLSLLAPRSSGDEMGESSGNGPLDNVGEGENDGVKTYANEVKMLETLLGGKESGKNLLGRMIDIEKNKGNGLELRDEERGARPNLRAVINDLCRVTPKLGRIFPMNSPVGRYKYDFAEAKHACEQQGASLATYHQLYEAWRDGLEHCACGFLSDGTSRYPMQRGRTGCGNAGINMCEWQNTWNAWCFRTLSICD
ncbi:hyaluronan and proteoglycan link protein 2-like [Branchiostoma floridae x Branchiostoma belcheri]